MLNVLPIPLLLAPTHGSSMCCQGWHTQSRLPQADLPPHLSDLQSVLSHNSGDNAHANHLHD